MRNKKFNWCGLIVLKCHGVKQNAKICAIGEQNVINRSLYLRRTKN